MRKFKFFSSKKHDKKDNNELDEIHKSNIKKIYLEHQKKEKELLEEYEKKKKNWKKNIQTLKITEILKMKV